MKIGIMTLYHKNHNYGGQLQAYALSAYLNGLDGVDCEQISYDYKAGKPVKRSLKSRLFHIYQSVAYGGIMKRLKGRRKRFEAFEAAIAHSDVYTKETIANAKDAYDLVFTGSDQVWNLGYADPAYFLGFLPAEKRASYAASFGKNDLEAYRNQECLTALRDYRFLSVREPSAKAFLDSIGIENCHTVCDPTLLLGAEHWRAKLSPVNELAGKRYLFVYLLGGTDAIRGQIKAIARKAGLEIVYIPHIHFTYQKRDASFADHEVYEAGPWEFLWLIEHAECVITDSFHCTLFSILFEKHFWSIDRGERKGASTNNRLQALLGEVGLEHRFADPASIDLAARIDHSQTAARVAAYREQSSRLLNGFIEEISNRT